MATRPTDTAPESTPDEPSAEVAVVDTADSSPRGPQVNLSGKRIRGIAQRGGSVVEVTRQNFSQHGIDHDTVRFKNDVDNWTLEVGKGKGISEEAAEFLTKKMPETFEYLS